MISFSYNFNCKLYIYILLYTLYFLNLRGPGGQPSSVYFDLSWGCNLASNFWQDVLDFEHLLSRIASFHAKGHGHSLGTRSSFSNKICCHKIAEEASKWHIPHSNKQNYVEHVLGCSGAFQCKCTFHVSTSDVIQLPGGRLSRFSRKNGWQQTIIGDCMLKAHFVLNKWSCFNYLQLAKIHCLYLTFILFQLLPEFPVVGLFLFKIDLLFVTFLSS